MKALWTRHSSYVRRWHISTAARRFRVAPKLRQITAPPSVKAWASEGIYLLPVTSYASEGHIHSKNFFSKIQDRQLLPEVRQLWQITSSYNLYSFLFLKKISLLKILIRRLLHMLYLNIFNSDDELKNYPNFFIWPLWWLSWVDWRWITSIVFHMIAVFH